MPRRAAVRDACLLLLLLAGSWASDMLKLTKNNLNALHLRFGKEGKIFGEEKASSESERRHVRPRMTGGWCIVQQGAAFADGITEKASDFHGKVFGTRRLATGCAIGRRMRLRGGGGDSDAVFESEMEDDEESSSAPIYPMRPASSDEAMCSGSGLGAAEKDEGSSTFRRRSAVAVRDPSTLKRNHDIRPRVE